MRTNIHIDDDLLKEAQKLTKIKTKKEVVDYALTELVKMLRRKDLASLRGKVKWVGTLSRMRTD